MTTKIVICSLLTVFLLTASLAYAQQPNENPADRVSIKYRSSS